MRHQTEEGTAGGLIVETEAYLGQSDGASHARFGLTDRSRVMFGQPGAAYVFFIYGMYCMFNTVTEPVGKAGAVLIRALEPTEGIELMAARRGGNEAGNLTNGPARLSMALGITMEHNGIDITTGPLGVWGRRGGTDPRVASGPRVGVSGSADNPWRFYMKGNRYVSR